MSEDREDDYDITDEETPMPGGLPRGDDDARGGVGDLFRKAVLAGMGAVFMTEEGIRKTVSELRLPKEAIGYVAGQAERTREEVSRVLRKEVRRFLNSERFMNEITRLLSNVTLEIKAEVRVRGPDEGGPKLQNVDAQIRVGEQDKEK